jgi:chemotaxis regulatin CheY-phosphate phosphatase CheZ
MNATSSKEIERSWREFLNRAYANNKARELMQDTSFLNWHMDEKLGMNSRQVEDEICVFGPMCIF